MKKNYILLIFSLFLLLTLCKANGKVERIALPEKYSNIKVTCFLQDKLGFLWIGTENGLLRYDSKNYILYNGKSSNLLGDTINVIYEDFEGIIWVGTNKAICKYDYCKNVCTPVKTSIVNVKAILRTKSPNLFCFGSDQGLFIDTSKYWGNLYERKDDIIQILDYKLINKSTDLNSFKLFIKKEINTLSYAKNKLWIGTNEGIYYYNLFDSSIERESQINDTVRLIVRQGGGNNLIINGLKVFNFTDKFQKILEVKSKVVNVFINEGKSWIATERSGIYSYDFISKKVQLLIPSKEYPNIRSIVLDNSGIIWIGGKGGGIYKDDPYRIKCREYCDSVFTQRGYLSQNYLKTSVFSFPNSKYIWVGSKNGEIKQYDRNLKQLIKCFKLCDSAITTIYSNDKLLMIGTKGNGLFCNHSINFPLQETILKNLTIYFIKKTNTIDENFVWVGTNRGLFEINLRTFQILRCFNKDNGINDNVYCIYHDKTDPKYLWIGTSGYNFIQKFNIVSEKAEPILYPFKRPDTEIGEAKVLAIKEHPFEGNIFWIGTEKNGLLKYNKKENSLIFIGDDGKLAEKCISNIFIDNFSNNGWLKTKDGIVKFNLINENFEEKIYLDNNSCLNWSNSTLSVVDEIGLKEYYPDSVLFNYNNSSVYLTKVKINGEEIFQNKNKSNEKLKESLLLENNIILENYDSVDLEFTSIEYTYPENIKYSFELVDINSGKIIYSNYNTNKPLFQFNYPPGKYLLKVWTTNYFGRIDKKNLLSIVIEKKESVFYSISRGLIFPVTFFIFCIIIILSLLKRRRMKNNDLLEQLDNVKNTVRKLKDSLGKNELLNLLADSIVGNIGYDYCVISCINHVCKNIIQEVVRIKPGKGISDNWIRSEIELTEENALSKTYFDKIKLVINPSSSSELLSLANRLNLNGKHQALSRSFFPVIYQDKNSNKEEVVCILECGYKKIPKSLHELEKLKMIDFLIDSSSKFIYKNSLKEVKSIVNNVLMEVSKYDTSERYLQVILDACVKYSNSDKGYMAFYSLNSDDLFPERIVAKKNIDFFEIKKLQGKIRNDLENHKISEQISIEINQNENSNSSTERTIIVTPIAISSRLIGLVFLISNNKVHFNLLLNNLIYEIINQAIVTYQKNWLYLSMRRSELPFNIFSEKNEILGLLIDRIKQFMNVEYIGIWEIETDKGIRLSNSSQEFQHLYQQGNFRWLQKRVISQIELLCIEKIEEVSEELAQFNKTHLFKSIIIAPLMSQNQLDGYLTIHSRRYITEVLPDEVSFLNHYIDKGISAIKSAELIRTYTEISESHSANEYERVLQNIVDKASKLLKSEPVVLFICKGKQKVIFNQRKSSGTIYLPNFTDTNKEKNLANLVLEDKSEFFKNRQELEDYYKKKNVVNVKDDFWKREKIKSLATIKLEHQKKPIGVIFFNYRDEKPEDWFDEKTKSIIEAFGILASNAIINNELIKQNTEYIENNINLKKQEEIENIASFLTHDSGNIVDALIIRYNRFLEKLEKNEHSKEVKKIDISEVREFIEDISDYVNDLYKDFQKLREYRQKPSGNLEQVNLKEFLDDIFYLLKSKLQTSNIILKNSFVPENISLYCFTDRLRHVFYNLAINAIDAMPNGGKLLICGKFDKHKETVIITIEDTGTGIKDEDKLKIFSPYYTTKRNGSGLGLSSCKYIIERLHNGRIEFKSTENVGTTFMLYLPIQKTQL